MDIFILGARMAPSACPSGWGCTRLALTTVVFGLLVSVSPTVLEGQGRGALSDSWTVSLAGGRFKYEPSADKGFLIIAVRADRPISKWVRLELGTSYTRPEIQTDAQGMFDPSLTPEHTRLVTFTLGIQGRLTVGRLEPYAGLSTGFFRRRDSDPAGRRFGRSTFQFPFGIRLWVTDQIGVRAEYRFDQDGHELTTHSDSEMTAGVFFTF